MKAAIDSYTNVKVDKAALEQTILTSLQSMIQLILTADGNAREDIAEEDVIRKRLEKILSDIEKFRSEQVLLFEKFANGKLKKQGYVAEQQSNTDRIQELGTDKKKLAAQFQNVEHAKDAPYAKDLGKYTIQGFA